MIPPRWFLLPAFLCASLLAARSFRAPLPPLPTTVFSRYGPVKVDRVTRVECGNLPSEKVVGCFSAKLGERRIQIADTLSLVVATFVLFHEKAHVAAWDYGMVFDDPEDAERVANAMARYQLAELLANP